MLNFCQRVSHKVKQHSLIKCASMTKDFEHVGGSPPNLINLKNIVKTSPNIGVALMEFVPHGIKYASTAQKQRTYPFVQRHLSE